MCLHLGKCMEAYVTSRHAKLGAHVMSLDVEGCIEAYVRFEVSNVCADVRSTSGSTCRTCVRMSTSGPVPSREGESARHVPSPGSARWESMVRRLT